MTEASGTLFVVSTPIGNMGDFSFRGVQTLANVAVVLAEDTREARKLLAHHGVQARVEACHDHNEARMVGKALDRLRRGENIALLSDAGTPLVSDPGFRIVRAAAAEGFRIVPIPGASAVLAALVASGLPPVPFVFLGFPPRRGSAREALFDRIATAADTTVLFETSPRLSDTLGELGARCGPDRQAVVARELTKVFEEVRRGTLGELEAYYRTTPPRGECVLLVAPAVESPATSNDEIRAVAARLRAEGMSVRDVTRVLVEEYGAPRNVAYRLAGEDEKD